MMSQEYDRMAKLRKKVKFSREQIEMIANSLAGKGAAAWQTLNKRAYLNELQKSNQVKKGEIPLNSHEKPLKELIHLLEVFDPDLSIFRKYHAIEERGNQKSLQIFAMPKLTKTEKDRVLGKLKEMQYDVGPSSEWRIISVEKQDGKVRVDLAKDAFLRKSESLRKDDIPTAIWRKIETLATKKYEGFETMLSLSVKLLGQKRALQGLILDFDEGLVHYDRTIQEINSDGTVIRGEEEVRERTDAFESVADLAGFKGEIRDEFLNLPEKGNLINDVVFEEVKTLDKDTCIVVHNRERYLVTERKFEKLDQDVNARVPKLKPTEIQSLIKDFYNKHNSTLKGFLAANQGVDPRNARITGGLRNDPDAEIRDYTSYFFVARQRRPYEKNNSKVIDLDDTTVLECISFAFERGADYLSVVSKGYSEEAYEALVREVYRVSTSQP